MEYKAIAEDSPGLTSCLDSLREAYCLLHERAGLRVPRARNAAAWDALAHWLLSVPGADPHDYLRFVFKEFSMTGDRPVYENMVVSRNTFCRYVDQLSSREDELALLLKLQADRLEAGIAKGLGLGEILEEGEFSAVFSYSAARAVGDRELASRYEEEARFQARFNPFYRQRLARWLEGA